MIKMQDAMELPIGLVLKASGAKLPTTHLVNPYAALRAMKRAKWLLPLLIRKEKKLRAKLKKPMPKIDWTNAKVQTDLQVF